MSVSVTFPVPKEKIREEYQRLHAELKRLDYERDGVVDLIRMIQKGCDHKGQVTGCNERDGSWGNPCPTCGYSY